MEYFGEFFLFLAEVVTLVVAILVIVGFVVGSLCKLKQKQEGMLAIEDLTKHYRELKNSLKKQVLNKKEYKKYLKAEKNNDKKSKEKKSRIFVLNFEGDIKASYVNNLREEITAILTIANENDEVVIKIDSAGGMMHTYGLAASQLARLRSKNIPLTAAIDKVAASGGYLMAVVAHKILAAPFAIVGSIGVVAQIPNFHRLLRKNDIEYDVITAGEYKRTLTLFGENTKKGREKFKAEVEEAHTIFKEFIKEYRDVDLEEVATGEHWQAKRAIDKYLVDTLITSDDYLLQQSAEKAIYSVQYVTKEKLADKLGHLMQTAYQHVYGLFSKNTTPTI